MNSLTVRSCTVDGLAARCGTLIAPEDRLTGKGRTIPVRFVVIPATSPDKAPDPVVWFTGGPGKSAVDEIPSEPPGFRGLDIHRDLVFIEQRGTGESNPLDCPPFPGLADKAALAASVRSCLAHLHGDLRFYTTAMYADDVSQVLSDLHYTKADLIGGSYGATAEQVFLLRHPSQVRTMTLISGTPLNVPMFERAAGNTQRALDYVFALCESKPACHRAFPHLAADWAALWTSLGKTPWAISPTQHPTTTIVLLDQDRLASQVYQALHAGDIGPIPVAVHTLAAAANKATAWRQLKDVLPASLSSGAAKYAGQMMFYEIECAEPWASDQPAALSDQRNSFAYQTDLEMAQWMHYVCPLIPRSASAVGNEQLTVSTVPVLTFNGATDPNDQPRNWAGAQQFLPDSRDIALPGQGHNVNSASWAACAGPLTQTFIDQASIAHLNTSCLAAIPAPAFNLTLP